MDQQDVTRQDALNLAYDFLVQAAHALAEHQATDAANVAGNLAAVAMGLSDRLERVALQVVKSEPIH